MTDKLHEWQKAFKIKDLLERDIEALEERLFADSDKIERTFSNTKYAWMLRWAIDAGWIESPVCEVGEIDGQPVYYYDGKEVGDMRGGAVRWLGIQVDKAYTEATKIPKNL